MEDLEKFPLKLNCCLPKLGTAELILTLNQYRLNTEGKPDIVSNKRTLIRWLQKVYEDLMKMWIRNLRSGKQLARFAVFYGEV